MVCYSVLYYIVDGRLGALRVRRLRRREAHRPGIYIYIYIYMRRGREREKEMM